MRFTMARPEVSCHPELLFDGARTVVAAALCYYAPDARAGVGRGRLPRYTWRDEYAELRARLDELGTAARRDVPRARRRRTTTSTAQAAVRAGVAFYGKNTMAITPSPRLVGRPRSAGHRGRGRAVAAARPRLRRRAGSASTRARPAPSTSPACSTRRGASRTGRRRRRRSPRAIARSSGRWSTAATSARTCARGTAAIEKRRRGARSPPRRSRLVSLSDWLERDGDELVAEFDRLYVPRNDRSLAATQRADRGRKRRHRRRSRRSSRAHAADDDDDAARDRALGADADRGAVAMTTRLDRERLAAARPRGAEPGRRRSSAIAEALAETRLDDDALRRAHRARARRVPRHRARRASTPRRARCRLEDVDVADARRGPRSSGARLGGGRVRRGARVELRSSSTAIRSACARRSTTSSRTRSCTRRRRARSSSARAVDGRASLHLGVATRATASRRASTGGSSSPACDSTTARPRHRARARRWRGRSRRLTAARSTVESTPGEGATFTIALPGARPSPRRERRASYARSRRPSHVVLGDARTSRATSSTSTLGCRRDAHRQTARDLVDLGVARAARRRRTRVAAAGSTQANADRIARRVVRQRRGRAADPGAGRRTSRPNARPHHRRSLSRAPQRRRSRRRRRTRRGT